MNSVATRLLALAAFAIASAVGAPSAMAQGTFTPGTGSLANCNPVNPPNSFDSVSCTSGSVSVNMTAWGFFGTLSNTVANTGWQQGRVGDFNTNGFGAYTGNNESSTGTQPAFNAQHAFDNVTSGCGTGSGANGGTVPLSTANSGCGGSVEAVLLDFGSANVKLSQVGVGYINTDADMSVYAWTGGGSGPTMSTQTLQSSSTGAGSMSGWTLVGSKDFASAPSTWNTGSSQYSSYFLVTTYFGATASGLGMGDDRFKVNTFTALCGANCVPTQQGNAPEPASLALASVALAGVFGVRRRLRKAK